MDKPNRYKNASPEQKRKANEATKAWRKANPEAIKAIRAKTDLLRKDSRRDKQLFLAYGISLKDYNEMLLKQNNLCAICFRPETFLGKGGKIRPLCVDHCHTTGKVRGLLCNSCNVALGNLDDNYQRILNAAEYIRKANAWNIL